MIRGRIHWPSDPKVLKVSTDGRITVLSAALRCAWWRNEARPLAAQMERGERLAHHSGKRPRVRRSILTSDVEDGVKDKDENENEDQEEDLDKSQDTPSTSSLSPSLSPVIETSISSQGNETSTSASDEKLHLQIPIDETRSIDSAIAPKFTHGGRRVDSQGTSLLLVTLYLMLMASGVILWQVLRRRWSHQKRRIIEIKPRATTSSSSLASVTHEQERFPDFQEQIKPLLNVGSKLFSTK